VSDGSICDIAGLAVGHYTDPRRPTGCTVVLCGAGAVAGVDVRGGAPGTRETDLLSPLNSVERVHAVLLAGGSAFGLDAASGVVRWLDERGVGLAVGPARIPIVPAAILYDLYAGDASIRPDAAAGHAACNAASRDRPAAGNVGAGAGALVGKLFGPERAMKGGIGNASIKIGAITVAAIVACNAIGDVIDPQSGRVVAGARDASGHPLGSTRALLDGRLPERLAAGMATTIGIVATDALLTKAQANQLARLGHHGLARVVDPLTPLDGDTLFALATGTSGRHGDPTVLAAMAAHVVSRAVLDAIWSATAVGGWPAASDLSRRGGP
jgi:L-aminopeptidase/D-esterase-like protein